MRKQRTHFEQVPLEVVKKIVEKEVGAGRTITPSRLGKKKLEGMPVAVSTANGRREIV